MDNQEPVGFFDVFKIGIGPSSSHTLGPWRAALAFREQASFEFPDAVALQVDLYGSLAKTGIGHKTDAAVQLGLLGLDPETFDPESVPVALERVKESGQIDWPQGAVSFNPKADLKFHRDETLTGHPNDVKFTAFSQIGEFSRVFSSIGGGFIVQDGQPNSGKERSPVPHPCACALDAVDYCTTLNYSLSRLALTNELSREERGKVEQGIDRIWSTMLECVYRGCHRRGTLPGGLGVGRRAAETLHRLGGDLPGRSPEEWLKHLQSCEPGFDDTIKFVTCFALAVNEENASMGRVVTAPTNGSAGVIPAVLLYWLAFHKGTQEDVRTFLLSAGLVGALFKHGATISAAMGGCQAEIGVSSSMAAAGLTEVMGGSPGQAAMAAEIAMEHHLGLTCDPIAGLVQIPCIERNAMGAVKAITAATMAIESDPKRARVSLDDVIKTMWNTAQDMNSKYKETAEGGLAVSVALPEC